MNDLRGKVALVTGASRGLGRGIALVLAEQGADVVVNYHSAAGEADEVCSLIRGMGRRDPGPGHLRDREGRPGFHHSHEPDEFVFLHKRAMEIMRDRGGGRIVFISSIVGHRGALYGHVHYAATKSGMYGMVKALARTGAPLGITVNAVAPGIIETELLMETHGKEEIGKLSASVPLGLGKPRDVGLAVAYVCGEGGRYITGATLDVNGGMYLR